MAARTYRDIEKIFCRCDKNEGTIGYQEVGDKVNYAFEERPNGVLYIYFEPSSGNLDWANNFDFWKMNNEPVAPYKDMAIKYKVHGGFLGCWKQVEDIIIEKITESAEGKYRWNTIVVVGYSHGGALAFFAHECCWYHRPDIRKNIWTIAFDAPRVMAKYWVGPRLARRWEQFYIFRNGRDIVTHMPPWWFGFCHVGKMIKIGRRQRVNAIDAHRPENIRASLRKWVVDYERKAR